MITEMFVLCQEFVILNLISFHFSLWKARNFKCMIMEAQRIWRSTIRLGLQYRSSRPKMFLEISQNSHENTCARASFLIKLLKKETLLKKRLWHRCFSANFSIFLRTPFFYRTPPIAVFNSKYCFSLRYYPIFLTSSDITYRQLHVSGRAHLKESTEITIVILRTETLEELRSLEDICGGPGRWYGLP